MQKFFTLLMFVFVGRFSICFAQHETDLWYFGSNAGLNFNNGAPANLTDGKVNTTEGSSCISDSAGNLLFYTDGVKVWNKNHQQMTNGNGLHGGSSSSQSALIVKQPGSDSLYYIFTTGQEGDHGLEYSVVDLSLQGGWGEVISSNSELLSNSGEQVTAAKHENGSDIWIITHKEGSNSFYAYIISGSGVNNIPVMSSAGTDYPSYQGYLKASHSGKQLASAIHLIDFCELYDFDQSTGIVSNPITLDVPMTFYGPYGIEFSPDDNVLYSSAYTPAIILQWDISSGIDAVINASMIVVDTTASLYTGALQLANDGKIYMARLYTNNWLGIINNPNVVGAGCNYVDDGFDLSPKENQLGLPQFPPFLFAMGQLSPSALFIASDSEVCEGICVDFTDQSLNTPASWLWSFPGGIPSASSLQNPANICYYTAGSYDVALIATNDAGSDTIVLSNFIQIALPPAVSITQSNDTLYSSLGDAYQWYTGGNAIPGATTNFYVPVSQNYYSVVITDNNGCSAADTISFSLAPQTSFEAADTLVCQKFCLDFFDQSTNNPASWEWTFTGGSPGSSTDPNPSGICYNNPGIYDVRLITTNAFGSDTLILVNYITVYATPPFPTITQNGNVLTSSPSVSYQWQLNSADIPGATMQSYTYSQAGLYTVVVGDSNGCTNSVNLLITAVENMTGDFSVSVFPNPSPGNFTVELINCSGETISLRILNALAQEAAIQNFVPLQGDYKKDINLRNPAEGVYFIEIRTQREFIRKKILVAK